MFKIETEFKCETTQDAVYALQEIISQLEGGYYCGYTGGEIDGTWSCTEDTEEEEEEDCRLVYVNWDVSDSEFETFTDEGVPREVYVPMSVEEDDIADWLSDEYGYCVESFTIENEE